MAACSGETNELYSDRRLRVLKISAFYDSLSLWQPGKLIVNEIHKLTDFLKEDFGSSILSCSVVNEVKNPLLLVFGSLRSYL